MFTCRACLETNKEMRSLDETFAIQYNLLTELEISVDDKMSQLICCDCWKTVNYFIDFRAKCINSAYILRNAILNNVKDDPDSKITTENNLNIEIKTDLKEEYIDCSAFDHIYDNNNFDTHETVEMFPISNIASEDNEQKSMFRMGELKEPIINADIFKRNKPFQEKNVVKTKETGAKVKQSDKIIEAKIKCKKKMKEGAAAFKLKQQCGICEASFDNKEKIFDHLEGHKKDTMCKLCHENFKEWPEILSHRFKHTPESQRRCHLCNKYCADSIIMEHHYRKMHYKGTVGLKCYQCDRSFSTTITLRKHEWSVHSKKLFVCDDCGEQFNTKAKIRIHVLKHTNVKPHVCKLCGYSSKYSSGLRGHTLRRHTALRVYCDTCGAVFPCQDKLDQHACKQKSIVCPICGLKMTKAARMARHLKTHREKSYKCQLCGETYKSRTSLDVHMNKHEGNRTKHCEYCPAKFYYGSALIKHRRTHTGERPYVCKTCGKSFTGNFNLKVHRQIHGEYLINKKPKTEDINNQYDDKSVILK